MTEFDEMEEAYSDLEQDTDDEVNFNFWGRIYWIGIEFGTMLFVINSASKHNSILYILTDLTFPVFLCIFFHCKIWQIFGSIESDYNRSLAWPIT